MKELTPIVVSSSQHYQSILTNTNFWQPYILHIANKHNLILDNSSITAGYNGTYPVFIVGKYVFKFFGFRPAWQQVFMDENKVHNILASDKSLLVPQIIHSDYLFDRRSPEPWPYNIMTKIEGKSFLEYQVDDIDKINIAKDLGKLIKKIHKLPCHLPHNKTFWQNLDLITAARKSILPKHLISQIPNFINQLSPFDNVLVNADIVETHVFINKGRLSGVIDWGDAAFIDRHYELGKLHLNVFDTDKKLLKAFLDAAEWPMTSNFHIQAMGLALYRQAAGLTQHSSFDIFYKIPNLIPLDEIASLEQLAEVLFKI